MAKECTKCGEVKPLTEFYNNGKRPSCKACCVKGAAAHRESVRRKWGKGSLRRPDKKRCPGCNRVRLAKFFAMVTTNSSGLSPYCTDCVREMARRERRKNIAPYLVRTAKSRAAKQGVPFFLKPSDISIPDTCPVLGIPLRVGGKGFNNDSPSLDRLVPSIGYVAGNVRVISLRANSLKRDATIEEVKLVLSYMQRELSNQ